MQCSVIRGVQLEWESGIPMGPMGMNLKWEWEGNGKGLKGNEKVRFPWVPWESHGNPMEMEMNLQWEWEWKGNGNGLNGNGNP